jgi:hypothetical protein
MDAEIGVDSREHEAHEKRRPQQRDEVGGPST